MKWTELLRGDAEYAYAVTEKMFDLVSDEELDWKPSAENNWMTLGQLMKHITESCGLCFKGFVTGDWGIPEGVEMSPEEMLPSAEKMATVSSVSEAKALLAADKKVAFEMLEQCGEERLSNDKVPAPWDPNDLVLGWRLKQMVDHLNSHKTQLFYYLKLQGKPVHTGTLWGM